MVTLEDNRQRGLAYPGLETAPKHRSLDELTEIALKLIVESLHRRTNNALGCQAIDACLRRPDSGTLRLVGAGARWLSCRHRASLWANVAAVKCETQLITRSLAADIPDIWS